MNLKQPQSLSITPVLNGFIVNVGCQSLVFSSASDLTTAIQRYYTDPLGFAREVLTDKKVNQMLTPEYITSLLDPDSNGGAVPVACNAHNECADAPRSAAFGAIR